ncbi:MAG: FKBP-type peptidyl-prolyl cis-trans isomerase [Burkholderiaceae bacterium]
MTAVSHSRLACTRATVGLLLFVAAAAHAQSASTPAATAASAPVVTPSGLSIVTLREGTGPMPVASDQVKVHYRGTLPDGKEFDSSYQRGAPATFGLSRVIKCWTEGVQRMRVGGKARLTCPPAIAYGERGAGGIIPPNATLVFDVELLEIVGR